MLLSAHSFLQLVFGRSSLGVGVGLASMIVPAYISECSPTVFRGEGRGTDSAHLEFARGGFQCVLTIILSR